MRARYRGLGALRQIGGVDRLGNVHAPPEYWIEPRSTRCCARSRQRVDCPRRSRGQRARDQTFGTSPKREASRVERVILLEDVDGARVAAPFERQERAPRRRRAPALGGEQHHELAPRRVVGERRKERRRSVAESMHVVDDHEHRVPASHLEQPADEGLLLARARWSGGELSEPRQDDVAVARGRVSHGRLGQIEQRRIPAHGARDVERGLPERLHELVAQRLGQGRALGVRGVGARAKHGPSRSLRLQHGVIEHASATEARDPLDDRALPVPAERALHVGAQLGEQALASYEDRGGQVRLRNALRFQALEPTDRRQALHDLERRSRPHRRLETQERKDERVERLRNVRRIAAGREHGPPPRIFELGERPCRKRCSPGQREVQGRPEREQVRAGVEQRQIQHVGRDERGRADDQVVVSHRHHRAEVDELRPAVGGAAHVARADVTMDEAPRMDERERRAHVVDQRARLLPPERAQLPQIAALEQLHGVVGTGLVHSVVVDLDDARVRQRRQHVKLALEHPVVPLASPAGHHALLERDIPTEHGIERAVHGRHATAPEHARELVPPADPSRFCVRLFGLLGTHRR